ncbi:hedgehog-interacting protein [Biomphalaria pfeifferi]|uniref:Hedgehog-interacting protein n=1 Tax=Biomphalaria pfeifferi TaxID=112525 RepID=A0AAD8B836_BIOPF|nr:hedgehog-interacting protein [Biomphalaria pfeifferi]
MSSWPQIDACATIDFQDVRIVSTVSFSLNMISIKFQGRLYMNVIEYFVICIVVYWGVLANSNTNLVLVTKPKLQYCSFFANRAPQIQLNLKNCTWFKENSCCRQEEIDAIFPRVKPLRGASLECQKYTNYLMCYVCAPNQNTFYFLESLTVCEEFCDAWYDACRSAILKGSIIKELYSNGSDFCNSRRFKVEPASNKKCFFFDAKQDTSSGDINKTYHLQLLLLFLFVHFIPS